MKAPEAHECQAGKDCSCSIQALEPNEECPVHGGCFVTPRCDTCGRFLPYKEAWERYIEALDCEEDP